MLDVVFWKWRGRPSYRSKFSAHHVNVAANMVRRHYDGPLRINCITDDGDGIDKGIRVIPLWEQYGHIRNPSFMTGPSCYRRLKAYSEEFRDIVGPRFVSMDLDMIVVGDLAPLWDRDDDFVIWGDVLLHQRAGVPAYNGSMWMMTAGARRQVWDRFDPMLSPTKANASGCKGSDQGWVTYVLGAGEAMWTTEDGVYSWRKHIRTNGEKLPSNARVVFCHGMAWDRDHPSWFGNVRWIRENYK